VLLDKELLLQTAEERQPYTFLKLTRCVTNFTGSYLDLAHYRHISQRCADTGGNGTTGDYSYSGIRSTGAERGSRSADRNR